MDAEKSAAMSESPEGSFIEGQEEKAEEAGIGHVVTSGGTDLSHLDISPRNALNLPGEFTGRFSSSSNDCNSDTTGLRSGFSLSRPSAPALPKNWKQKISNSWEDNKSVLLMAAAQFGGSAMTAIARLMETESNGLPPMDPFQILFARQSVTVVLSLLYMWWAKVPEAPLGQRAIRPLLLLRGFGGFFGVFGLYYSVIYLPLADAIVMTFLAPMLAAWICSLLIKTPFTRTQKIAGIISVFGVVLITRPFSFLHLFTATPGDIDHSNSNTTLSEFSLTINSSLNGTTSTNEVHIHQPTPAQRAFAVLVGLIGVLGAACAYVTISWVGKRAHPLISVNYFATWCTFISVVAMLFVPSVTFRLPATTREWLLLLALGLSGFTMQFLMTSSLAHKRSNRVLNVVYIQMLFALGFDKILFNESPGLLSILGSGMILGSVIWASVKKDQEKVAKRLERDQEQGATAEEEAVLVAAEDLEDGEVEDLQDEPMEPPEPRGVNHCLEMREIH